MVRIPPINQIMGYHSGESWGESSQEQDPPRPIPVLVTPERNRVPVEHILLTPESGPAPVHPLPSQRHRERVAERATQGIEHPRPVWNRAARSELDFTPIVQPTSASIRVGTRAGNKSLKCPSQFLN